MRADLKRGRTEIDSFSGEISRTATALGLPAPIHTVLASLTHELAEHPDRREAFRRNKHRFMAYLSEHGIRV